MLASICIALAFPTAAAATPQAMDRILVDGKRQAIREVPLGDYLRSMEKDRRFDVRSTANWKGYTCCWELKNSKLWLIEFNALRDGKPVPAEGLFGRKLPIEATWYSGRISVMYDVPPFANLDLTRKFDALQLLVQKGVVSLTRRAKIQSGFSWGEPGFKIDREGGELRITEVTKDEPVAKLVQKGDVLVGLLDKNGFSLSCQGEPKDVVSALLRGDAGTEFTIIVKREKKPTELQAVTLTRINPLLNQFREEFGKTLDAKVKAKSDR